MVKSINEICHFLGKQTIAEYIENEDIKDCLLEIGVDFAQGYHIEPPHPLMSLIEQDQEMESNRA
jgi:EAL domain-containing protein (putative c-di-GMP-specific phosphodiesterase class I)